MSEYQFVAFRAVDKPLTERELMYAQKQSTRAEITRWSFENEYHYGDFRGNTNGLLRRGYDVHLHYANYGVRTVAFRLRAGMPFPKEVWSQYLGIGELSWKKDATGKGGILSLKPCYEPDEIEEIWSPGDYIDDVVEVRNLLAAGDLRILYILWLCAALCDESESRDVIEPTVPGGLTGCVQSCGAFLDFFGLDPMILVAASEGAPTVPALKDQKQQFDAWIDGLREDESKQLLKKLLVEDPTAVKTQMIAESRESDSLPDWPTATLGRRLQDLLDRTDVLIAEHDEKARKRRDGKTRREAAKRERERQKRMKEMAKDSKKWLRQADELVAARGRPNYEAAAEILGDIREAVGGAEGEQIARKHAAHLTKKHPTLTHLKSSLRKQGLWE